MEEAKTDIPMVRGHVIPSYSHLQCPICISWAMLASFFKLGQHLTTLLPNFVLFARIAKLRNMWGGVSSYKMCKAQQGWQQSQTLVIFSCPKIDEFCMILCNYIGWPMNFDHPFLPSLTLVLHNVFFHIVHIDAFYLPNFFLSSLKHGILVQSSKNL
jgi:hypothetical protein